MKIISALEDYYDGSHQPESSISRVIFKRQIDSIDALFDFSASALEDRCLEHATETRLRWLDAVALDDALAVLARIQFSYLAFCGKLYPILSLDTAALQPKALLSPGSHVVHCYSIGDVMNAVGRLPEALSQQIHAALCRRALAYFFTEIPEITLADFLEQDVPYFCIQTVLLPDPLLKPHLRCGLLPSLHQLMFYKQKSAAGCYHAIESFIFNTLARRGDISLPFISARYVIAPAPKASPPSSPKQLGTQQRYFLYSKDKNHDRWR